MGGHEERPPPLPGSPGQIHERLQRLPRHLPGMDTFLYNFFRLLVGKIGNEVGWRVHA